MRYVVCGNGGGITDLDLRSAGRVYQFHGFEGISEIRFELSIFF